ncbi:phosphoglycerate dehydrogenase-like oxidoreductase [Marinitoga piezophila KA3]|uniref:Phosphoglycerate dehydrogenase-like oxidoreductase n=1 Tax=Marinitoga piezophila (strain DSM 14283 / JCM 11233 / KA3) TaxID=443254 RepID=H2J5D2_MARPK|nr:MULTISPECIES: D-2-hydroxyacid dehydrogenase [Marinitoga]AEX84990.1 phosphoglycerate dehydrogenase-like oxidoreductase [Marinitoga piezophila KA3]APT75495.1 3-phosphoglycerate dehydrogenase [Marinitoga sp. 1137]
MWIHINDPLDSEATEKLKAALPEAKITIEHFEKDELIEKVKDFDVLVVRSATKATKEVIENGTNLKLIARAGMGLDNVDLEAAKEKGIKVINTPGANSLSVAELVVGYMLSVYRHLVTGTVTLREGKWEKKKLKGFELTGKTLGIVGFGNIGKLVRKLVTGFDMEVLVFDVFEIPEEVQKEYNVKQVSLEELIKNSDIITLHVPLTEKTRHLISEKEFEMMKDNVVIINAARGGVVDEEALLKYLENGKVLGAGLDVFETEPPTSEIQMKLLNHPMVVATPHIGATTKEAQKRVGLELVDKIVDIVKNM